MTKSDTYKARIREFLQPLDECQWRTGREVAFAVATTAKERASVPSAISAMYAAGEVVRKGEYPRGYSYRLNPYFVPEERDPHAGPASAYEGPAIGDGSLCPLIACRLPEAA